MNAVAAVKFIKNYEIHLEFKDGFESTVDIRPLIGKGFTNELLDPDIFKKVEIDSGGGLVWPNGFDVCPNYLRRLAEHTEQTV